MIGLTNLWTNGVPMEPNLDRRRALLVMDKIDEILAWEKTKEQERDVRFVELGQYLCEVRAGQYWRLEKLKSFDRVPGKALPRVPPEGLLPDGHPREADQGSEAAAQGNRLAQGGGDGEGGPAGWRTSSIVHPGCTRPRT